LVKVPLGIHSNLERAPYAQVCIGYDGGASDQVDASHDVRL